MKIHRSPDAAAAARDCAAHILALLGEALKSSPAASLAISGGTSPRPMFEIFSRAALPWERVHLFWVDERIFPPTDPRSNFKLAADAWLNPAKFPARNIHRIEGELDPEKAAAVYVAELREYFGVKEGEPPRFDVIHRGMGPDGHTASLFPGERLIEDRAGIAAAVWVEKMQQWRVTLLPAVLEAARQTAVLAVGADKAGALKNVLEGPYDPLHFPAQIGSREDAARHESLMDWFVDPAAAAELRA